MKREKMNLSWAWMGFELHHISGLSLWQMYLESASPYPHERTNNNLQLSYIWIVVEYLSANS